MADAFEIRQRMVARIAELTEKNAALTEAVRVLSEALNNMVSKQIELGPIELGPHDYLQAHLALTQAKELLK